jgi:alanine racemase
VATHLPVPDEDGEFTEAQLRRFEALVLPHALPLVHSLNSAGVIAFASHSADMVRAGLMLYGSSPIPVFQSRLRPVMAWKTRIALVREVGAGRGVSYGRTFIAPHTMRVATLVVGYADGYLRALAGHDAAVLICGRRCPLLGRVTMDMVMVDVTAIDGIAEGEEVVLLGRQAGEEISAAELAERAGTIAWEIFTGVKARVERVYRD